MAKEILFGEEFSAPQDFLAAAATVFATRQAHFPGAMHLAADLTAPKSEHQLRRLRAALAQMDALQP